jgi:hypothetical protein
MDDDVFCADSGKDFGERKSSNSRSGAHTDDGSPSASVVLEGPPLLVLAFRSLLAQAMPSGAVEPLDALPYQDDRQTRAIRVELFIPHSMAGEPSQSRSPGLVWSSGTASFLEAPPPEEANGSAADMSPIPLTGSILVVATLLCREEPSVRVAVASLLRQPQINALVSLYDDHITLKAGLHAALTGTRFCSPLLGMASDEDTMQDAPLPPLSREAVEAYSHTTYRSLVPSRLSHLTDRERDVVALAVAGRSNQEIADRMYPGRQLYSG